MNDLFTSSTARQSGLKGAAVTSAAKLARDGAKDHEILNFIKSKYPVFTSEEILIKAKLLALRHPRGSHRKAQQPEVFEIDQTRLRSSQKLPIYEIKSADGKVVAKLQLFQNGGSQEEIESLQQEVARLKAELAAAVETAKKELIAKMSS